MIEFILIQIAKVVALLCLLGAPFIPSSRLRIPFLFLVLNLIILVLATEFGVLGALSKTSTKEKDITLTIIDTFSDKTTSNISNNDRDCSPLLEKPIPYEAVEKVTTSPKRCRSKPSLFFINSCKEEANEKNVEEDEEIIGGLTSQELFLRAESFIRNFYKQVKIQREQSWKKLYGLYNKPN